MKLGIVSSILSESNFEEMIDIVSANGLECVEVACWPQGKAERRYAGVSHIDTVNLTAEKANEINAYANNKGVKISALAYYPNPLDEDLENRSNVANHLMTVIDAAKMLDVNLVTTFIGRIPTKNLTENLVIMKEVWTPILKHAEQLGVKVAIENCPMLFTEDEWPGGQNLMTTPAIFKQVFEILDSPMLGLNFDPSHYVWQKLDYLKTVNDFKDKLFHIHFKDIKVYEEKLSEVGTQALPLQYMSPKLPGLGDVDWGAFVSSLTDIGYDGYACIEVEDKAFEANYDRIKLSVTHSTNYMRNYVPKN